jgi:hypothetical protein
VRCPSCDARNPDGAAWCNQCLRPLGAAATDTATAPEAPAAPVGSAQDGDTTAARQRDVRTVDGEVEWRCPRCDVWSPLPAARCTTCGGPRRGFGVDERDVRPPPSAGPRLAAASLVLPGLGHVLAGRYGSGVARALLAVSWLLGGLVLLRGATRGGASPLPSVPLLVGAVTVWAASLADVRRLTVDEGREWLHPRALLWLTSGVIGSLVVLLLMTATRLSGGA